MIKIYVLSKLLTAYKRLFNMNNIRMRDGNRETRLVVIQLDSCFARSIIASPKLFSTYPFIYQFTGYLFKKQ